MSKPRLLVTRRVMPLAEQRLKSEFDVALNDHDRTLSTDELIAAADGKDGILSSPSDRLDASVIARLPATVKIIANHAVGLDNIDLNAAKARGIVITNTPDVLSAATAEIAILLMLGAARRASEGDRLIRDGGWKAWGIDFMCGTEITGKSFGVIGMGRIGQMIAARARGFDMTVHYYNRKRLSADEEQGAIYHDSVESLLPHAQVLSISCPLTPDTRKLINAERLALLPRGAIVVNTARGPIVDDDALIAALKSGHVAAAGLDVFDGEPNVNPAYADLPNTLLLPHIGSATTETRTAMGMKAIDNLAAFFRGETPPDRVI